MYLAQPWVSSSGSSHGTWSRPGVATSSPHDGAMAISPVTRAGCFAATCTAHDAPHDSVTSTAAAVSVASSTATMSAAYSTSV